jgi:oxygen-dependent protoporphyrinogen oxidase
VARVAVVGAGLAGLVAARDLAASGHEVTVLEASARVGGELAAATVAGVALDVGAEAFLVTRPEAAELTNELGLEMTHPTAARPAVVLGRRLVPLPPRTLLGVPASLAAARGALGPLGVARAALDLALPPQDVTGVGVGRLVRRRLGSRVADRLVDPLLSGVYAGSADDLDPRSVAPALAVKGSLIRAARRAVPSRPSGAPVFGAPVGGVASLVPALARGLDLRTSTTVTGLRDGSVVTSAGPLAVDAVVLAVRGGAAARLLGSSTPVADYASVATVTLAFDRARAGRLADPDLSGWLVPPGGPLLHKGLTISSSKWAHLHAAAPELVLARASVGRYGVDTGLRRGDDELAGVVASEVAGLAGARGSVVAHAVTRWGGALPQYTVGHPERVAALRAALPPRVAVCGAAYDGVGIPAVIASARRAAADVGRWVA